MNQKRGHRSLLHSARRDQDRPGDASKRSLGQPNNPNQNSKNYLSPRTNTCVLLILLISLLSHCPLSQGQEAKKNSAGPGPGLSLLNEKSGMPYMVLSSGQGENGFRRSPVQTQYLESGEGIYNDNNIGGGLQDYPSYFEGREPGRDKRYRYVGKRLRDRYRMAFGLGKRRYAESNSSGQQLMPYSYYLGPMRQERSALGTELYGSYQDGMSDRLKRRMDRYRTFFGLGKK